MDIPIENRQTYLQDDFLKLVLRFEEMEKYIKFKFLFLRNWKISLI